MPTVSPAAPAGSFVRAAALCAVLFAGASGIASAAPAAGTGPAADRPGGAVATYRGTCDASAAVALDAQHFIVGNDETDVLATYRQGEAASVGRLDLVRFLGTRPREESDIEGAAAVGTRVYWITSHGRNSRGEPQPSRHRLFATDVVGASPGMMPAGASSAVTAMSAAPVAGAANAPPQVVPVGTPYRDLLRDLVESPSLAAWNLGRASTLPAEADGGFNIEGLAATPDGRLLVGFRNPLREGRALVVPIDNPGDVVAGQRAKLGAPIELDLGARGIRSLELVGSTYYIVAGPIGDVGTFALYRWTGRPGDTPEAVPADLGTLRPEALFAIPGTGSIELASDDGGIVVDGRECKKRKRSKQAFRTLTLTLTPPAR